MSKRKKDSQPVDISAKSREVILSDIQQFEKEANFSELRGYLIQLAKWGTKPEQYEYVFRKYLTSAEADLRQAAVFCLLFALRMQKPAYRQVAVQQLVESDKDDFDTRHWAAASLAIAYRNTKDPELLRTLFAILDDEEEDKALRSSIAGNILLVSGLTSHDLMMRIGSFTASLKATLLEFDRELVLARQMVQKQ